MNTSLIKTWSEAGEDLGISVEAPYAFVSPSGKREEFEVYLPQFGCKKGAVLTALTEEEKFKLATDSGYFCSQLDTDEYGSYDRGLFIETLNDYGWFGEGQPPSWYSGEAWG